MKYAGSSLGYAKVKQSDRLSLRIRVQEQKVITERSLTQVELHSKFNMFKLVGH